jgi:hypothetical protein
MTRLHPEILSHKGKRLFVVLPYNEFVALQEQLEDARDLLALRRARKDSAGQPLMSLADVKRRYRITARSSKAPTSQRRKAS